MFREPCVNLGEFSKATILIIPWVLEAFLALSSLSYYTPLMSLIFSSFVAGLRVVDQPSTRPDISRKRSTREPLTKDGYINFITDGCWKINVNFNTMSASRMSLMTWPA